MSHFTVLVIGENPEKQLAPFHEFECTGQEDEYVQDIDKTDELAAEYNDVKREFYVSSYGHKYEPYENFFYRDPTEEESKEIGAMAGSGCNGKGLAWSSRDWEDGRGYRSKVHYLPEGFTVQQLTEKEADIRSFRTYVEEAGYKIVPFGKQVVFDSDNEYKYNYALEDKEGNIIKVIRRTNPNPKWDWYQLGGRWTGFFKVKEKVYGYANHSQGNPGLMTEIAKEGYGDSLLKRDIDIDNMRVDAYNEAKEQYQKVADAFPDKKIPKLDLLWKDLCDREDLSWDEKRDMYHNQPAMVLVKQLQNEEKLDIWFDMSPYQCTQEAYASNAAKNCICTFVVLKDGKWYERGEMGWWGAVSNEKGKDEWLEEFNNLFDSLPDDTLVSVYDCHI